MESAKEQNNQKKNNEIQQIIEDLFQYMQQLDYKASSAPQGQVYFIIEQNMTFNINLKNLRSIIDIIIIYHWDRIHGQSCTQVKIQNIHLIQYYELNEFYGLKWANLSPQSPKQNILLQINKDDKISKQLSNFKQYKYIRIFFMIFNDCFFQDLE
ncbi:hypothetical protein ABPG72_018997 [Tetrahymena utriculariae]